MTYFILSFLGGAFTIFAPCILPIVPFVFARTNQPLSKGTVPMLAGMACTFTLIASLGAVAGDWAIRVNEYGRATAILVLGIFGAMLLLPSLASHAAKPFLALGSRLSNVANVHRSEGLTAAMVSFVLGVATGLLWVPCAGPILGLILTGALLQGPSVQTSSLLLCYAAGSVTSLAIVLTLSKRAVAALSRHMNVSIWARKGLGVAVLSGVAAIALGLDTGVLARLSLSGGNHVEKKLIERFKPTSAGPNKLATYATASFHTVQAPSRPSLDLPDFGPMPSIAGAVEWINSAPLASSDLRGKVVIVDFWTFGCINCRNSLPHVRDWYAKYKDQGLVVVGIHSPEFAFEKNLENVKRATQELGLSFPVAVDNSFAIWRAYNNMYWPALYFVDAKGRIRFTHFGEGEYEKSERVIQQLLGEANAQRSPI